MYIVGMHIPISESQALNALSWASTIVWFRACMPNAQTRAKGESEAGPVKSMPPGNQGQLVSATHGLGLFIPMGVFVVGLPLAVFHNPKWLDATSLPTVGSRELYIGLRLAGCACAFWGAATAKYLYKHLGSQWAAIGVRERPKIVKTGPYAIVRHPGYALAMMQELAFIPMFWNWIFAPGFAVMAIAFAIKMPMEENVIEQNKEVGDAYKQYKKEVRSRVLPFIW